MKEQPAYSLSAYAAFREELLLRIQIGLEADPRFAAAWLVGSYGRGEQDSVSDLDLFVAVWDEYAFPLCRRQPFPAAGSPPQRMELFQTFGEPVNIHENHNNAPAKGTFSAVLYHQPPVIVDWTLIPRASAARLPDTRLLFDRAGIGQHAPERPVDAAPGCNENAALTQAELLAERVAFFSMMSAITAKYVIRGRSEQAQELLAFTEAVGREIEAYAGSPAPEATATLITVEMAPSDRKAQQKRHIRHVIDRAEDALLRIQAGEHPLRIPRVEIETILRLQGK